MRTKKKPPLAAVHLNLDMQSIRLRHDTDVRFLAGFNTCLHSMADLLTVTFVGGRHVDPVEFAAEVDTWVSEFLGVERRRQIAREIHAPYVAQAEAIKRRMGWDEDTVDPLS